jgi:Tol biopolymer transport system component
MRKLATTIGLLAAVLSAVAATGSQATTPGRNGLIVYAHELRAGYGVHQLFTIRPDGTGNRPITRVKGSASLPDWSPNGKLIAFEHETRSGQPDADRSVALISARGTDLRELTPTGAEPQPAGRVRDGNPAFTPDGRRIVFVRDQGPADRGLWIMNIDGSGLRRLTRNPFVREVDGGDLAPNVSPDGKRVSFVRIKRSEKLQALFVVRIDGTGLKQVTPYALEVARKQDWAPDGKRILMTTNADWVRPQESANLVTIRPDGSGMTPLTQFTGRKQNAFAGSFSPDGKQIIFRLEQGDRYALAVVDTDGQNVRMLTRLSKAKPRYLDWGTAR